MIIRKTDSYKPSHWNQFPPDATHVEAFWEPRGGEFPVFTFFGLQYIIQRHLQGNVLEPDEIEDTRERFEQHFGRDDVFNEAGWSRMFQRYHGWLPIEICAVPEGTRLPVSNAAFTVRNTDPEFPWLPGHLETLLSHVWYPSTVATQSRMMRDTLLEFLELSGDPAGIDFKLHDFGYRGCTCDEQAGIGSAAHLLNFKGTDTLPGIDFLYDHYGARTMPGFSIPAGEHSVYTAWGREHEVDAYANALRQYPSGLIACVSDAYDIYNACENIWGGTLKDAVLARDGVLVIRPDSGDPLVTLPRILTILADRFGCTVNAKGAGYRVLHPKVRLIQGDGIDRHSLRAILRALTDAGWSADNIAFGSGGGLLQNVNRDTMKCKIAASAICRGGIWQDIQKDPVTDPGKRSKAGRLQLVNDGSGYRTVKIGETLLPNLMVPVFRDGRLLSTQAFEEIRERASL